MRVKKELTRAQTATQWIVVVALTASMVADVLAWATARKRDKAWQEAVDADVADAKRQAENAAKADG